MSQTVASLVKKFRKYHKWPGIIVSLFALFFAVSGIILNHRNLITSVDLPRRLMPPGYQYKNWNLAAVKSSLPVGKDSILIYGNIGAWMVTDASQNFHDFNDGFPVGIDMRKIYSVVRFKDQLVAGTHFGLYHTTVKSPNWQLMPTPEGEKRITDLTVKGDTLLILTRNNLYASRDLQHLELLNIPPPVGYQHKSGLFLTLWELHSGELFGFVGKLFVDLLGFTLIFLTISGLLHFLFPGWIARRKRRLQPFATQLFLKKLNLKWHNLIGYIFVAFLVINTTAGMFLRPPLLIPIASAQVGIIPHSHLDTNNPWHDKLRRIIWNDQLKQYLVYTSDGFFLADAALKNDLVPFANQPIVSIMGCNVLEPLPGNRYLVGSFSGMFIWNPLTGEGFDYFTGAPAETPHGMGRPVGQNMVAGYLQDSKGREFWIDYNLGMKPLDGGAPFPEMTPEIISKSPISLWNAALEVHTGRVFEHLVGPFYLLYVPLVGLSILTVLISGFMIWWLAYRKSKKKPDSTT